MQVRTNMTDESAGLILRLRRAKYAQRGEAVELCLLAAEEIGRLSYDLGELKRRYAQLASGRGGAPVPAGSGPAGHAGRREVRPS